MQKTGDMQKQHELFSMEMSVSTRAQDGRQRTDFWHANYHRILGLDVSAHKVEIHNGHKKRD